MTRRKSVLDKLGHEVTGGSREPVGRALSVEPHGCTSLNDRHRRPGFHLHGDRESHLAVRRPTISLGNPLSTRLYETAGGCPGPHP